jgi:hypothetical protein
VSDRPWKLAERKAAALIGGKRYWANSGEAVDCESEGVVLQVKHVKRLSLAQLEALAVEAQRQGQQRTPPKLGVLVTKRRGGRGNGTPYLITMTESTYREMNGDQALAALVRDDAI